MLTFANCWALHNPCPCVVVQSYMHGALHYPFEAAPIQQVKLGPTVDNNASTPTMKVSQPIWLALCGVVRAMIQVS